MCALQQRVGEKAGRHLSCNASAGARSPRNVHPVLTCQIELPPERGAGGGRASRSDVCERCVGRPAGSCCSSSSLEHSRTFTQLPCRAPCMLRSSMTGASGIREEETQHQAATLPDRSAGGQRKCNTGRRRKPPRLHLSSRSGACSAMACIVSKRSSTKCRVAPPAATCRAAIALQAWARAGASGRTGTPLLCCTER